MSENNAIRIWHNTGIISGQITLPASKSESNRALIIQALTDGKSSIKNLSVANDTKLLQRLLQSPEKEANAEDAGTAMRFFTAFAAVTNQQKTITGTARMQQRPIGLLIDALRELGADIEYLNHEGYPPIQLNGIDLSWPAQEISVPGNVSSQFISALLLVAPVLHQGLRLNITGNIASKPYIDMTLSLMQHFGAKCFWEGNSIICEPVPYTPTEYTIPADWSSAGYWYSLVALSEKAKIFLPGLKADPLQADSRIEQIAALWGVETRFSDSGAHLLKTKVKLPEYLELSFFDSPDLAQTVLVLAAATGVRISATGLESLKIKETDRVAALQTELLKLGAALEEKERQWMLNPNQKQLTGEVNISTYFDHRMAMAFAPLALRFPVIIDEPSVVRKSYPAFWEDLKKVGFDAVELT